MKRLLVVTLALAAPASAQQVLTLQQAVDATQQNLPALRQAQAATDAAKARVGIARAPLLPQVSLNLGYARRTSNFTNTPGTVPTDVSASSAATFNSVDYLSSGLTATQLVWDFGQTLDRYRAQKLTAGAQEDTETATGQRALYAVRTSFFAARAQKALQAVAKETLESQERHFAQIEGFVEVGSRPQIDVAQARTDRANAKLDLINAQNAYAIAKAVLNQAMGVERDTAYDVADEALGPVNGEASQVDPLVEEALSRRPEYAALEKQMRAQELIISSVRGGYWPSIGVATGFTDNGRGFDTLTWNWSAGATLSWQLFEGFGTHSAVEEAGANLRILKAQSDTQRQQVRLDVSQAVLAVSAAQASIIATDEALTAARERLRLSEGRYQTGVGNVIELGDAQVSVTSAAAQRVQAEYRLSAARSQLLLALGR